MRTPQVHRRFRPAAALAALMIALPALVSSPASASPGPYVALGDSYSAGPGIVPAADGPPGCGRSAANYPHLLAGRLQVTNFTDAACAGAATEDMFSSQGVQGGENPPQLDSITPDTALVTLQIGGNDIGFTEIVTQCLSLLPLLHPCTDRYVVGGVDEIAERIRRTAPKVDAVLAEVARRAPGAEVLVVGYPSILPGDSAGCWPLMLYAPDDLPYLVGIQQQLNAMLQERAGAAGATFVDTYTPSLGLDACGMIGNRWVEPLIPLSPAAPVHPNAQGMAGMAAAVAQALGI